MAEGDAQLMLAMPVGLPAEGVDAPTFYALLASGIEAGVSNDAVLSVHTDPAADYSGVHPMVRAALWYAPAGSPGPDGAPVASPTLFCRTWLWEMFDLRAAAAGTAPAVIAYANLEEAAVRDAVTAEVSDNETYAPLSDAERAELVDAFMAEARLILVDAGTRVGQGAVDPAHGGGYRRVDITLHDAGGNRLDPAFYFSLWGAVGGEWVDNHPLLELVRGPFAPVMVPLEGSTRVKFTSAAGGLSDASSVQVGGAGASSVRAGAAGTELYFTAPAGVAGPADVVVDGTTYAGALTYVEDVVAAAQASRDSYLVHLAELKERAEALKSAGTLDEATREVLLLELEAAMLAVGDVVTLRSYNSGAAALDAGAGQVLSEAGETFATLLDEAKTAIWA